MVGMSPKGAARGFLWPMALALLVSCGGGGY